MKPLKLQRSIQGQDVSEEYTDLASRLKAKQAVEIRLLEFMDKASTSKDLLAFSDQLGKVQEEIERIKGRIRYLDQNVAFSTIELRVYQGKVAIGSINPGGLTLGEKAERAILGSLALLSRAFAGTVVFLAATLPIAALVAIVVVPTIYFVRKRRRHIKEEARRKLLAYENNGKSASGHPANPSSSQPADQTTGQTTDSQDL
jgi:hypothetical protein